LTSSLWPNSSMAADVIEPSRIHERLYVREPG
jgi:hypothetical protein